MIDTLPYPDDFLLAQKCLEGDLLSISQFQQTCRGYVADYLVSAGADAEQAQELANEMRADCLAERADNRPRLATYGGNSPLRTWLKAVALNKLVQRKRNEKRKRQLEIDGRPIDDPGVEGEAPSSTEAPLLEIMRGAVEAAFHECDAEDFVLVQLAHANDLLGRELAQMYSCSEAKISRDLERARRSIADATMNYVREKDPWLVLKWEDFLDLCRVASPACFGVE
ncbi:MAG: hypothetical protein ABJF10_15610 [Chthoniobacter sp.]|uniref:RNA polymerase sigma factor n=1 Tax=Chthoniobacter sp. TaxID=2510640 RepID=UPI0032A22A5B